MKILHFIETINQNSGGLYSVLTDLINAISDPKIENHIFTNLRKNDLHINNTNLSIHNLNIKHILSSIIHNKLSKIRNIELNDDCIIHLHGLWMPIQYYGYLIAKHKNIPFVISPHGMLMPNALNEGYFKKKIAGYLYQNKELKLASSIITASKEEYKALKITNLNNNIKYISHGVKKPKFIAGGMTSLEINFNTNHRNLLFLGRLNETKGVAELLNAWKEINTPNWRLIIAGPKERSSYYKKIKKIAHSLEEKGRVVFTGAVYDEEKEELFRNSDIFILPTKSENFGLVIAEALIRGIPVITTKDAPWKMLEEYSIGWWIENNHISLLNTIQSATMLSPYEIHNMGIRAAKFASKRFSWDIISNKYLELYKYLLKKN